MEMMRDAATPGGCEETTAFCIHDGVPQPRFDYARAGSMDDSRLGRAMYSQPPEEERPGAYETRVLG